MTNGKLRGRKALCLLNVFLLVAFTSVSRAQVIDDALRLGQFGTGIGARALGMGGAYTGVANDYSAIYWNPAGLTQINRGEFSFGLSTLNHGDNGTLSSSDNLGNTTLLGNSTSYTNNATNLNALGVVYPVPVHRGAFALAFGFDRRSNFTSGLSVTGFNPSSSIIQTYVPATGTPLPTDLATNPPWYWQLGLVDSSHNSLGQIFKEVFPFQDSVLQHGLTQLRTAKASGGLNDWSAAAAFEISKNLSVGVTVTLVSGSYRYDETYREQDNNHFYRLPYDLQELKVVRFIQDDITGASAKFGLMYSVPDHFRLGFGIRTPTSYTVKEDYAENIITTFYTPDANGYSSYGPVTTQQGPIEYDVHTPWVFSAGASVILSDLVLSGDVEYTDWTQLEFANAGNDLMQLNNDFNTTFRGTYNARGGAEYEIRPIGLRLRGGLMYNQSPYQGQPSSFAQKYITGGLGVPLSESAMLDIAYAHGWWKGLTSNYTSVDPRYSSDIQEDITTNTFYLTLVVRF